jgi:hypothetical protein
MPMKADVKALWVAALRSGQYRQGRSQLTNEANEDCCLGVLCKLAVQAGADVVVRKEEGEPGVPAATLYDGEMAFLPDAVAGWAGMYTSNPVVIYEDNVRPLATLNDGMTADNGSTVLEPQTFAQIADLIEADDEI